MPQKDQARPGGGGGINAGDGDLRRIDQGQKRDGQSADVQAKPRAGGGDGDDRGSRVVAGQDSRLGRRHGS